MQAVRRRDTKPELLLRRALWAAGQRGWRCDYAVLPGRPDLAFTRLRVAVFVDGGFWHGHPSRFPRPGLSDYWLDKIRRNVERDRDVDARLLAMGWLVVRLWDFEVTSSLQDCVRRVERALGEAAQVPRPGVWADRPASAGLEPPRAIVVRGSA
jgi:DNA mismatch endonuclease (patch repair protein)